jgi:tRNA-2-methylthio-N6-dimethylallyladenosine synthase
MSVLKKHRYFIKTYGCQANIADSQKIAGLLDLLGFVELIPPKFKTEKEEFKYVFSHTDIFIINSCSVRQKSEDKVYGIGKSVKEFLNEKKENRGKTTKKPLIFLSGCIVGSTVGDRKRFEPSVLKKKTEFVDVYLDFDSIPFLPKILKEAGLLKSDKAGLNTFITPKLDSSKQKHAYVNVSTGCDNFCTFCVVPYARGKEVSRTEEDILCEIDKLIKLGVEEITLCGQNVNSWGLGQKEKFEIRIGSSKKLPFVNLLKKIHKLKGIKKIDFISSNPFDFTNELVEILKLPKISNYIHIAVQSGNNEILKAMNRRHTVEEYIDLVNRIRKTKPGIEIGTDIIVGFPNETEKQFEDSVKLMRRLKFDVAFISMYSARKGTVAGNNLIDNVTREEKKRRLAYIIKVWRDSKRHE